MISLEQYRIVIGLYNHVMSSRKKVCLSSCSCVCVMPVLLIMAATVALIAFGVVLAGDVERNPGPRCAAVDCHNARSLHRFPRDAVRSVHFFETVVCCQFCNPYIINQLVFCLVCLASVCCRPVILWRFFYRSFNNTLSTGPTKSRPEPSVWTEPTG